MVRKEILQNPAYYSIVLFVGFFFIIVYGFPSLVFEDDGSIRQFGIGFRKKNSFSYVDASNISRYYKLLTCPDVLFETKINVLNIHQKGNKTTQLFLYNHRLIIQKWNKTSQYIFLKVNLFNPCRQQICLYSLGHLSLSLVFIKLFLFFFYIS